MKIIRGERERERKIIIKNIIFIFDIVLFSF
jgi:hypothetical protein